MSDNQSPIEEANRCKKCGQLPELIEEASESPLTGELWDRYKCDCGYVTVRYPHD